MPTLHVSAPLFYPQGVTKVGIWSGLIVVTFNNTIWLHNCYIQQYHFQGSLITEQNIGEINPFFFLLLFIIHVLNMQAWRCYTPPKQHHKMSVQYTMSPHTRYVALFTWYFLRYITHNFTFYIYIHTYIHSNWILTVLQEEISLYRTHMYIVTDVCIHNPGNIKNSEFVPEEAHNRMVLLLQQHGLNACWVM